MAEHGRVLPFTDIEQPVAVDVVAGVDAKAALVAGGERVEGFGFNQPSGGFRFLLWKTDEGVVVDSQQEGDDEGHRLKHGQPSSVPVRWVVLVGPIVAVQSFFLGFGSLHERTHFLQRWLTYRRSSSSVVGKEGVSS